MRKLLSLILALLLIFTLSITGCNSVPNEFEESTSLFDSSEGTENTSGTSEESTTEEFTTEEFTTEEFTTEEFTTEEFTTEEFTTEEFTTEGDTTEGETTEGDTTEGNTTEGDTTEGNTTEGETTEGDTTEGDTTEGNTTEGNTTEGETTEGDTTEGETTEGDTTEGETTEGDTTEGETTEESSIEEPQPEQPQPEQPQPEQPQPEQPQPELPQPEQTQPEQPQPELPQPEQPQPEQPQPEQPQPEQPQPEQPQPEQTQPEQPQPDQTQPEQPQPEEPQPEQPQPEQTQPEEPQPEQPQPEEPKDEHSHNYTKKVTAPTCTADGYTTYTCSCGDTYTSDTVSATGHTEKTVPGKAATCTETGLTDGTVCATCNTTIVKQTTIAVIAHSYSSKVTAPTCTAEGYTTYTCSCGDTYTSDTVSATGHSWQDATTSAPKTCTVCGTTEGDPLTPPTSSGYSQTLYITYIDVGQGDSIFIKVGDCDILIDAGTSSYGSTVSSYLKSQGVDDIELMINSHPDSDHYGGLSKVLQDFVVEKVWYSSFNKTTTTYTSFRSVVSAEGCPEGTPAVGTVFEYGYMTLTVLYSGAGATESNDSSIVVMLEYGSFKFLFTGDIGESTEGKLLSSGKDLSCDVLKVGHHGSKTSSTAEFLSATGADYAVISVGAENTYGHPTSEALNRLSAAGITVYRTDLKGNIKFSTNGATLTTPDGTVGGTGSSSGGSSSGGSSSGSSSSGSSSSGTTSSYYIGNTETKVFHLPTCSNLPAASKQNTMYNYDWIVNIAGYSPCGRCLGGSSSSGTTYIANKESNVYHLSTCSYLPAASKQTVITNTSGYTPCGHCIGGSNKVTYIANTDSKVYHLSTCAYLPAASKQKEITSTSGYTPCGHCIK